MLTPTILYDSFNARHISHADVATTFVSNQDFFSIATNSHTIVLGPRGCGKTTIFKMLTTPALKNWNPKTAEEIKLRDGIPFVAIYIPSDELWKKQLDGFKDLLQSNPPLLKVISKALITTNILSNFCKSIKQHIESSYEKDVEKEYEFSKNLIIEWSLPSSANNLASIRQSLESRKNQLIAKIDYAAFSKKTEINIDLPEYYFLDYIKSIHVACIAFERIFNEDKELKWALCFDELELVSKEFFDELIANLRIAPSNILFKLSAGPLVDFSDTLAQISHDFKVVKMWPFNTEQEIKYQRFLEEIAKEYIKRKRATGKFKRYADIDLYAIFGDLDYNSFALKDYNFKVNVNAKESEPESLTWHAFKRLASEDSDLLDILENAGINAENPIPRTTKNDDTIIRKLKEIVINRLVFKKTYEKNEISKSRKRSRKVLPIYYGKPTILKICEGNPRFIIGLMSDIFSALEPQDDIALSTIPPIDQTRTIRDVSTRFMSMLQTYPTTQKLAHRSIDLEWLIKRVGSYFDKNINEDAFKLKPANCFYVRQGLPKEYFTLLKIGVELGAFIKIDVNTTMIQNNYTQNRYRLSYLLAPQFKLPLRLYGAIDLLHLLTSTRRGKYNINQLNFDMGYED